jgi:hypothetical protein
VIVAHSRFEPVGDGVKFTRIAAGEGKLEIHEWSEQTFEQKYAAMQEVAQQLRDEVVAKIKPVTAYLLAAERGDYTSFTAVADLVRGEKD